MTSHAVSTAQLVYKFDSDADEILSFCSHPGYFVHIQEISLLQIYRKIAKVSLKLFSSKK